MSYLSDLAQPEEPDLLSQLVQGGGAQDMLSKIAQITALFGDQGGGGDGAGTDMSGFSSGGDNPWGIDPNGMDLVTRHGTTLDQNAMRSLQQARRALGLPVFQFVGGGYRSPAASAALHDQRYDANGNLRPGMLPAADAGQSMHNYGLAFDSSRSITGELRRWLLNNGWFNGASFGDPPHWSYGRSG